MKAAILPVTPFAQNCSILWCEDTNKGALVDPGGDVDRILSAVEEQGIELEKILITHGHIDHAGGAAEISERLNIPIEGPHKDDTFLIEGLGEQGAKYGFAGARPFTPDRWLENEDNVSVGNIELTVRHCPGHTPGHIVFFVPSERIAFVGDVLFQGSIGRTDLARGSHEQLVTSICERLWPLGNDVAFVPGHGAMSTFGQERQSNPYVADLALQNQ
jgi:glyoxylase-like metal-dependent hydrolase (beta-lactamase superfamily II)